MIKRRSFLKGMAVGGATLATAGLPNILLAENVDSGEDWTLDTESNESPVVTVEALSEENSQVGVAPVFEQFAGQSNWCAKYAYFASKYKHGKCHELTNAWNFSDHNHTVEGPRGYKMKIKNMNSLNNFNDYIPLFAEKGIIEPGMIVGTKYGHSSWNGKFYDKYGTPFARAKDGGFFVRRNKKWVREIISPKKFKELKPIPYTHLMCYDGVDKFGEPVFLHQFPYYVRNKSTGRKSKEILQTAIRLSELPEHSLSIKEIFDGSESNSEYVTGCRNDVRVLGHGEGSRLYDILRKRNAKYVAMRNN